MDSMMYTKGEFDVVLSGGSPWGFSIKTQSGNSYNRGKVFVAEVVQGGKADSSGNVHVGDEILAVNGYEFDNKQQATEYVKAAKKELILKIKRSQDKRRMNIRLAGELPNNFDSVLESSLEKDTLYGNTQRYYPDKGNNKRSSKEFEKDLSYQSYAVNTSTDYNHNGGNITDYNQVPSRLTRPPTNNVEYTKCSQEQDHHDNLSSSPPKKITSSPCDKVQRVRIRSTNVSSPDHYKCSPGSDTSSLDDKPSESHSPTPSHSSQSPFNSSVMEEFNRTWPSVGSPDMTNNDVRLAAQRSFKSVSAARLQFEQMVNQTRTTEQIPSKPKEALHIPPQPPSRNSSFRSTRLSSSSAVFSDSEKRSVANIPRHGSFSGQSCRPNTHVRYDSSSEELDKPQPPRRFSQSKVLTSFRSNKKPGYLSSSGESISSEQKDDSSSNPVHKVTYHHSRTQSLPSSKLSAFHVSSRSWVTETPQNDEFIHPRSSSFSRTHVGTNTQQQNKTSVKPKPNYAKTDADVIRAFRTGESSSETQPNVSLKSKSTPYLKPDDSESTSKPVVVLKENSIMQRLLMEHQDEPTVRSKTAAIRNEIDQRTENTTSQKTKEEAETMERQPRGPTKVDKQLDDTRVNKPQSYAETRVIKINDGEKEDKISKDVKISAVKVDKYLDKLMVKLDNPPPVKQRPAKSTPIHQNRQSSPMDKNPMVTELPPLQKNVESNSPERVSSEIQQAESKQNNEESRPQNMAVHDTKQTTVVVSNVQQTSKLNEVAKPKQVSIVHQVATTISNDTTSSSTEILDHEQPLLPAKLLVEIREDIKEQGSEQIVETNEQGTINPVSITETVSTKDHVSMVEQIPTKSETSEVDTEEVKLISEQPHIKEESKIPDVEVLESNRISLKEDQHIPHEVIIAKQSDEARDVYKGEIIHSVVNAETNENEDISKSDTTTQSVPHFNKESCSETKDDNGNDISLEGNSKSFVNFKDNSELSAAETSLRVFHSRENSASSLLEETLISAKAIANIYSVESPIRNLDDESLSTASEMRRFSLAKRQARATAKSESPKKRVEQYHLIPEETNEPLSPVESHSHSSLSSCGSPTSSGIISPKLEVLEEQKELLISSMEKKVELLKEQENEINLEMIQNDVLGKRVGEDIKSKTSGTEFSKFELFVSELNNIIGLLLSLTQRMQRYEVMLEDIDLAEENGREKRDNLLKRIDRVKQQYDEACRIKEINDKRGETVAKFVEQYCSDEGFADFQHFVDMKTQLALTQAEIKDKVKLGEEKLNALTSANLDWSSFDLNGK